MEAACQHQVQRFSNNLGYHFVRCNAPILRLDEGPCEFQVPRTHRWGTYIGQTVSCWGAKDAHGVDGGYGHAYLGPLASECEKGHPQ